MQIECEKLDMKVLLRKAILVAFSVKISYNHTIWHLRSTVMIQCLIGCGVTSIPPQRAAFKPWALPLI